MVFASASILRIPFCGGQASEQTSELLTGSFGRHRVLEARHAGNYHIGYRLCNCRKVDEVSLSMERAPPGCFFDL